MGITNKEQVRDGFLGDLPEDIQTKVMNIHKFIKDTVNDLLDNVNYEDLKQSSWAMSCIDGFCVMPKDKSEIGSIRVYKKGKTFRCMIQATGHFRNHQYGWIEELLHDFICNVYGTVRPKIRQKYDMTITNEGRTGEPFEGFDIYPNPKSVKDIWDKLEDRKTKTVTESTDEIECTQDLMDYYEYYNHISYDQFFLERSHGKLNTSFRIVRDTNTDHYVKIVFDLNTNDIDNVGHNYTIKHDNFDEISKKVRTDGNNTFSSMGTVKAIVDMSTNEKLDSVTAVGPISKNSDPITYTVGKKEVVPTFKSTSGRTGSATGYNRSKENLQTAIDNKMPILADIGRVKVSKARHLETIGAPDKKYTKIMNEIENDGKIKNGKITSVKESTNTSEYNVDMSESEAKKTLRVLSQSIINDTANKKGYKVSQYTANIYANIITKNLLPVWAKGYRKLSITLDSYQSFFTFEFKTPTMTQDFVSRFVAGRESIGGFLHRQSEIRIKMSPRIFHTMKNPDDAFNFFKSAIRYYDGALERYSEKLMTEIMKLNHEMKHLISTSKMSGIVTYPMSLLFIFDDVKMDTKDTFKIAPDDISSINKFIRSIYTNYASPEKEKKKIVEDIQTMVKALKEAADTTDENIRQLSYLPEAVASYFFGGSTKELEIADRNWIYEQLDTQWLNNQKNYNIQYLQESFGVKKLKKIPTDLVAYITIETEAIRDSNDKMMISSYCLGKIEIVEWYIELLEVGSKKYVVPHTKPYLETVRTQLLACFKKIMDTQIPKKDRPMFDIQYPKGYEG